MVISVRNRAGNLVDINFQSEIIGISNMLFEVVNILQ